MASERYIRRDTGIPAQLSPISLVSLARDALPDELPSAESRPNATGGASVASAIARLLGGVASSRGADALHRILVVEPYTRALGLALRAEGISAQTTALIHARLPREVDFDQGFDRTLTDDWTPPSAAAQTDDTAIAALLERLGVYDALIVSDLTRTLSPTQLPGALAWLANCLNAQGFLVLSEPGHTLNAFQLARDLMASGLELVTDPEYIGEDWPRALLVWRRRSTAEAHRYGVVQRVEWPHLEQDIPLQRQLITSYQEVFGGEEWREWVRCVRPGCGRHYSRAQFQALQPQWECLCGWDEPLVPYHPAQEVLRRLRRDLTPAESSCAYIRYGDVDATAEERRVGGFAWGYLSDPRRLAHTLLPDQPGAPADARVEEARKTLMHAIDDVVQQTQESPQEPTQGRDNPAVIYYHAEIGIVASARNLGLAFYLFERSLRFAWERGAQIVMLRTAPRSQAHRLVTGLGMRTIYRYSDDQPAQQSEMATSPLEAAHGGSVLGATTEVDDRVVMWGRISTLLETFANHSDTRLVGYMARGLRAAGIESDQP